MDFDVFCVVIIVGVLYLMMIFSNWVFGFIIVNVVKLDSFVFGIKVSFMDGFSIVFE